MNGTTTQRLGRRLAAITLTAGTVLTAAACGTQTSSFAPAGAPAAGFSQQQIAAEDREHQARKLLAALRVERAQQVRTSPRAAEVAKAYADSSRTLASVARSSGGNAREHLGHQQASR